MAAGLVPLAAAKVLVDEQAGFACMPCHWQLVAATCLVVLGFAALGVATTVGHALVVAFVVVCLDAGLLVLAVLVGKHLAAATAVVPLVALVHAAMHVVQLPVACLCFVLSAISLACLLAF